MKARDKCGIFAVVKRCPVGSPISAEEDGEISKTAYTGLFQLQHRGRESAGISVWRNGVIHTHKDMGTIDRVFEKRDGAKPLDSMGGVCAIGHVRYSTTGASGDKNSQPIACSFRGKDVVIGHNGNVKTDGLQELVDKRGGYEREDTTDTGFIAALIATSKNPSFIGTLVEVFNLIEGAFSLVILYDGRVYAAKDRFGIRPLCLGMTDSHFFAASETRALDNFRAQYLGEVEPGTIALLDPSCDRPKIINWTSKASLRRCVFEDNYFSMPDSLGAGGMRIKTLRESLGAAAAREHPIMDADVITPVLDSGLFHAVGYARELEMIFHENDVWVPPKGLFDYAFIRGRVERTFMDPIEDVRRLMQNLKFSVVPEVVRGMHIVVVDDSIVRGNVMPYIIETLRFFGARKISVVIPFPPLRHPCHLGIDLPYRKEYVAHGRSVEEIAEFIGADYLGYLSIKSLYRALNNKQENFCDGCLTNNYPVSLPEGANYRPKEK